MYYYNYMRKDVFERIFELILERYGDVKFFAEKIGMKPSTLYTIRKNPDRMPRIDTFEKICRELEVSADELLGLETAYTETGGLIKHVQDSGTYAFVDIIDQKVSAGPGQEVLDPRIINKIPIISDVIAPYNAEDVKAVEVVGDSMTGVNIFDGDIVFFVPGLIRGDGIYVISVGLDVLVKRLKIDIIKKTITIISENPKYPEEDRRQVLPMENDILRIEGKVKGWVHKHPY